MAGIVALAFAISSLLLRSKFKNVLRLKVLSFNQARLLHSELEEAYSTRCAILSRLNFFFYPIVLGFDEKPVTEECLADECCSPRRRLPYVVQN